MKADSTYIPLEEMVAIAEGSGCEIEEQKSYYKVTRPGVKEQFLYVAKTKNVGRVDLSGFELKEPEVVRYLGGEKFGRVHYQLRFDKPAEHIKIHFKQLCDNLGKFVSLPKSKRGRPVGLKGSKRQEVGVVTVKAEMTIKEQIDFLVAELEGKKAIAAKMGFNFSKKTQSEYDAKLTELRQKLIESYL
jgi:hypothetical protein